MENKTNQTGEPSAKKMATELNIGREFREKNIQSLFNDLDDYNQEQIYGLVWSLTAKDLLYKTAKQREQELEEEDN